MNARESMGRPLTTASDDVCRAFETRATVSVESPSVDLFAEEGGIAPRAEVKGFTLDLDAGCPEVQASKSSGVLERRPLTVQIRGGTGVVLRKQMNLMSFADSSNGALC